MYELKMERNLGVRPWPEPWQYKEWVSNLKTEFARVVAPFGKEVMRWLAGVFQLEGHEHPVPDSALQQSGKVAKASPALRLSTRKAPRAAHCCTMGWSSNGQHGSYGAADGWHSQWWQCSCRYWNAVAKKKCGRCGVKKSWAQYCTQHWEATPDAAQHNHFASEVSGGLAAAQDVTETQTVKDMQNKIKDLDVALNAVPTGGVFTEARNLLEAQKNELKKRITESKPLHLQLESCSGAVTRASKRLETAMNEEARAKAYLLECTASVARAQAEVEEKAIEKRKLELALAASVKESQASQGGCPEQDNCLDKLKTSMETVIAEMSSGAVNQVCIAETRDLMGRLFNGLQMIANQSAAQRLDGVTTPSVLQMLQKCANTSQQQQQPAPMSSPEVERAPTVANANMTLGGAPAPASASGT